ncbi:MAG: LytTR family DNA-binding domain-containing protein [Bryobacteraceae bacterium]
MLGRDGQPRESAAITALLVDDERLALDELSFLLKDFPDIEIIGTASNGLEAVQRIDQLEPDLVFLDVQMPGLDGVGVIRKVQEAGGHIPYFVLTTAYNDYAVEAFQLEALDYLLKPVEKDRLEQTISRAQKWLADRAKAVEAATPAPKSGLQRSKILVRSQGRNLIVDAQDVVYATIDDGLITVVATGIEGSSNYRTIEELQSNLDPEVFWRVHRSYLVNIHRIREVIPWFKSSFQLKMDDKKQTEIPVSRVQTKRLRAMLKL